MHLGYLLSTDLVFQIDISFMQMLKDEDLQKKISEANNFNICG